MRRRTALGQHTLLALQAMRGLAAELVVLHHAAVNLAATKYMGLVIMGGLFAPRAAPMTPRGAASP